MGQAKLRGTFEERKAQAIAAGRSHRSATYSDKTVATNAGLKSQQFNNFNGVRDG